MKHFYKNLLPIAANNKKWSVLIAGLFFLASPSANAQQRIVGGEDARIEELPWQVHLGGCGASVISEEWILTAAHCKPRTGGNVTLGQTTRSQGGSQTRKIAKAIIHPNYNSITAGYDIALIKVDRPIDLSDPKVAAIQLVTKKDEADGLTKDGVVAITSGWGATSEGGSSAQTLQKVSVPINTDAEATKAYGNRYKAEHMISAGYIGVGGKDACQGDSGGPFVVPDGDSSYKLAGIVSWGDGCARRDKPGIYTRVATYAQWVYDNTGIVDPVGINSQKVANIKTYIAPNPSNGIFTINANNLKGSSANISIYDLSGKVAYTSTLTTAGSSLNTEVNVTGLNKGVYFLKINASNGTNVSRLVIQ